MHFRNIIWELCLDSPTRRVTDILVTDSTTYKEFRQTNAYQTIATNYVGFNASNAEIKACLEWLIKKGREGAQTLPSTQEYKTTFGR